MEPDAIARQPADRMIERRDLHRCEFPVVLHGGLGIDHVPVRGERRIVELQDKARLDNGPVLFAHRIGRCEQEFLVGSVIGVADPRGAAGAMEVMKPSSMPAAPSAALKFATSALIASPPI
jgi:hypothetical protein